VRIRDGVGVGHDRWFASCVSRRVAMAQIHRFGVMFGVEVCLSVIVFDAFMIWLLTSRLWSVICFSLGGRMGVRRGVGVVVCGFGRRSC